MTTAWVLGGGGARGIAHIGAIKALQESGSQPDLIVGTSAGSLIAALYCLDADIERVEALVHVTQKKTLLNKQWDFWHGLSDGSGLYRYMALHTRSATFSDLQIPLTCVCLDYYTGQLVSINQGDVAQAVQASCALPPLFQPVCYQNTLLIDGGAVAPVPVSVAREQGADHVIAVSVGIELPDALPKTALGMQARFQLMRSRELDRRTTAEADVVVRVQIPGADILDDHDKPGLIQAGYYAAKQALSLT